MNIGRRFRYRIILLLFAITAITLYSLDTWVFKPGQVRTLTQAVGEALIVAVVVSLVVEPRLLRTFGEEIASQTFWTSFYSRAPENYRDAVKELASATQFTVAMDWRLTFDWADDRHENIRLSIHCFHVRENRDTKAYQVRPGNSVFESRLPEYPAEFTKYTMSSADPIAFSDLIHDGLVRTKHSDDGRLILAASDPESSIFDVPSGHRYTVVWESATCVDTMSFYPLTVTRPTLQFTVRLCGNALNDLFISILHPGSGTSQVQREGIGSELEKQGTIPVGGIFLTGQDVLVAWKSQSCDKQPAAIAN